MKKSMLVVAMMVLAVFLVSAAGMSDAGSGYPNKNIEVIVPAPAGAELDVFTRAMVKAADFGVSTSVVNKPGGTQSIGLTELVSKPSDGYTIGVAGGPGIVIQPIANDKLIYDVDSFAYLAHMYDKPEHVLLVTPQSKYKTIDDILNALEAGERVTFATPTALSVNWMVFSHFFAGLGEINGVDYLSNIETIASTGGTAGAQADLLGGHVDVLSATDSMAKSLVDQKLAVPLISLSDKPSRFFPSLTTAGTTYGILGCGDYILRVSFIVKKDTPQEVIDFLSDKILKATASEEYQKFVKSMNFSLTTEFTPEELEDIYKGANAMTVDFFNNYVD